MLALWVIPEIWELFISSSLLIFRLNNRIVSAQFRQTEKKYNLQIRIKYDSAKIKKHFEMIYN